MEKIKRLEEKIEKTEKNLKTMQREKKMPITLKIHPSEKQKIIEKYGSVQRFLNKMIERKIN